MVLNYPAWTIPQIPSLIPCPDPAPPAQIQVLSPRGAALSYPAAVSSLPLFPLLYLKPSGSFLAYARANAREAAVATGALSSAFGAITIPHPSFLLVEDAGIKEGANTWSKDGDLGHWMTLLYCAKLSQPCGQKARCYSASYGKKCLFVWRDSFCSRQKWLVCMHGLSRTWSRDEPATKGRDLGNLHLGFADPFLEPS